QEPRQRTQRRRQSAAFEETRDVAVDDCEPLKVTVDPPVGLCAEARARSSSMSARASNSSAQRSRSSAAARVCNYHEPGGPHKVRTPALHGTRIETGRVLFRGPR